MATKKLFFKWVSIILLVWFLVETSYQIYLRTVYVKNGVYEWEEYAVKRNERELSLIKNYFLQDTIQQFLYSKNPNEGTLARLPDSVTSAINKLNNDLAWGINPTKTKKYFSIDYNKINDNKYVIHIDAGANFKASHNGYDFSLTITDGGNLSNDYLKYERYQSKDFYMDKESNKEYRSKPFILRYNCNSYDLLIFKPFR
jgi:hypothetical protein